MDIGEFRGWVDRVDPKSVHWDEAMEVYEAVAAWTEEAERAYAVVEGRRRGVVCLRFSWVDGEVLWGAEPLDLRDRGRTDLLRPFVADPRVFLCRRSPKQVVDVLHDWPAAPYGSLLYPSGRHSVFYEEHLDSYFFYFRDTIDRRTLLRRSNP